MQRYIKISLIIPFLSWLLLIIITCLEDYYWVYKTGFYQTNGEYSALVRFKDGKSTDEDICTFFHPR